MGYSGAAMLEQTETGVKAEHWQPAARAVLARRPAGPSVEVQSRPVTGARRRAPIDGMVLYDGDPDADPKAIESQQET